jgi:hypothetical protein
MLSMYWFYEVDREEHQEDGEDREEDREEDGENDENFANRAIGIAEARKEVVINQDKHHWYYIARKKHLVISTRSRKSTISWSRPGVHKVCLHRQMCYAEVFV